MVAHHPLWHRGDSHWLFSLVQGVTKLPTSTAAAFTGVFPISAVLLSYGILGEPFMWSHLAGVLLVMSGIGLIAKGSAPAAKQ